MYWSNWEATEPQGVVITEAVKAFEEETGATVDLQFKGRKGIKEGLIPALDADQQVDMFDGAQNKSNYGERILCLEDLVKESDYEKDIKVKREVLKLAQLMLGLFCCSKTISYQ